MLPESLKRLIHELTKLPGIGPRSAERLALWLVTEARATPRSLSESLNVAVDEIGLCSKCGSISIREQLCDVCDNPARDKTKICVVQGPLDVVALERSGIFDGLYHVLGGVLSPLEGITPDDLRIPDLIARVKNDFVSEVIIATNPSAEGDITASYIAEELRAMSVRITRLARGLPSGGQVDYADADTLEKALNNRVEL
jgi:recombination protein RecR